MPDKLEADETVEETPSKPKVKKGKSKLLTVGIPVVLVQIILAYIIVVWLLRPSMPEKEKEEGTKTEVKKPKKKEAFGIPFMIEKLTINIQSEDKRSRFLVGDIGFECEAQKTVDEMTTRVVQIKDIVIGTISSKKLAQLLNNTFIEDTLKTELRDKVNDILMNGQVKSVYFSQRIIN
jgi:flagellar basal body-associated protein FliL